MGDTFELQEMGILDEMGEYTGYDTNYRPRRKNRNIPRGENVTSKNAKNGVFRWLNKYKKPFWDGENKIVAAYALYRQWPRQNAKATCVLIQKEFGDFIRWYKKRINKL